MSQPMRREISALSSLDEKKIAIYTAEAARRQKSVGLAYVLFVFLGYFGVHQFYVGKPLKGLAYLACTFFGWLFLFAGIGAAFAADPNDPNAGAAIGGVILIGWFALFVEGCMGLWDLFTLPRQIRKKDDRMRADLIRQLQTAP